MPFSQAAPAILLLCFVGLQLWHGRLVAGRLSHEAQPRFPERGAGEEHLSYLIHKAPDLSICSTPTRGSASHLLLTHPWLCLRPAPLSLPVPLSSPSGLHSEGCLCDRGVPEGPALPGRLRAAEPRGVSRSGCRCRVCAKRGARTLKAGHSRPHTIISSTCLCSAFRSFGPLPCFNGSALHSCSLSHRLGILSAVLACSYGPLAWINGGYDTAQPGDLPTKDGVDVRLGGENGLFR